MSDNTDGRCLRPRRLRETEVLALLEDDDSAGESDNEPFNDEFSEDEYAPDEREEVFDESDDEDLIRQRKNLPPPVTSTPQLLPRFEFE